MILITIVLILAVLSLIGIYFIFKKNKKAVAVAVGVGLLLSMPFVLPPIPSDPAGMTIADWDYYKMGYISNKIDEYQMKLIIDYDTDYDFDDIYIQGYGGTDATVNQYDIVYTMVGAVRYWEFGGI